MERIRAVVITEQAEEHIWGHRVRPEEVEDVCLNSDDPPILRRTREGRILALGQTAGGRYLFVVLAPMERGRFLLVTARDMEQQERRYYRQLKG
jgi:uncharacterized protein